MRLSLTKEQMEFLKTLGVEDRDYTKEEIDEIIDRALAFYFENWEQEMEGTV